MATIREILLTLALLLVIAGAAGNHWVLSERGKEQNLFYQRQQQFKTRVAEADKVLGCELNIKPLSGEIAEENLQDESVEKEPAARSDIRTISLISLAVGLIIFVGWIVSLIVFCVSTTLRSLRKFLSRILKYFRETKNKLKALLTEFKKSLRKLTLNELDKLKKNLSVILTRLRKFSVNIFRRVVQVWHNLLIEACFGKVKKIFKKLSLNRLGKSKAGLLTKNKLHLDYSDKPGIQIDTLYHDKKSTTPQEQVSLNAASADLNVRQLDQLEQNIRKTILVGYYQSALKVQNSLKTQNETIEKQVAEVMQMAQTIQDVSSKNSEPVKSSLDELTRQISAIREYASSQHERIEKLQEGYDWNIIKNFCLRVIRCIDNLENRIEKLSRQGIDTTDLEEIMDELLFALESSGVEQFRPQINSDYDGKEKIVEVVKDRVCPGDPDMTGKIAEVVKPGYQYVIDDSNFKVVRAARVKLFS